jgi:2-polyprenyl-6-methoxyphenol hydroxylase-like FAD-dependent oxidoreductase
MVTDVLVVGAGPVGLVAACELARRGVRVRIVDKLSAPTTESRAILVHARSLEMLDQLGIAGTLLDTGVLTYAMRMHAGGREIARVGLDTVDSAFPYSLTTAQTETERVLTERLAELGVTVDRGVELTELEQDTDGVGATLARASGTTETSEVRWVVGADGGHSSVRRLVGTRLAGSFKGEWFILGDVEGRHELDGSSMYSYFGPTGPLLVFPMRGNRARLIAQIDGPTAEPTLDALQRIVDQRAGGGIRITESHWLTDFEIHHAQVPAYRHGRVFLAGDAAHVHSPAGGQGMNTGIQDAANLAWKLASTVDGRGGDRLLDSYQAERHPVAAAVIKSTTLMTTVGTLDHGLAIRLRNEVIHAATALAPIQHVLADQLEETTLRYRHSPIVVDHHPRHVRVRAGDHAPHVEDTAVQTALRAAVGQTSGHVVLTVAGAGAGQPAGGAVPGAAAVLVADRPDAVPGYDAVVADPGCAVAARYGFERGGRAVIRPDGYLGLVGDLDADADAYFAQLLG